MIEQTNYSNGTSRETADTHTHTHTRLDAIAMYVEVDRRTSPISLSEVSEAVDRLAFKLQSCRQMMMMCVYVVWERTRGRRRLQEELDRSVLLCGDAIRNAWPWGPIYRQPEPEPALELKQDEQRIDTTPAPKVCLDVVVGVD